MFRKPIYAILVVLAAMPPLALAQQQAAPSVPIVSVNGPFPPVPPPASATTVAPPMPVPRNVAPAPAPMASNAPASTIPAENPNVPRVMGSGSAAPLLPLPPQVPQFMPSGAPNLDWYWTEDGGARLYWNDVIIPQQLKMAGATWIDPALVPQLVVTKAAPRKRYYKRRIKRVKSTAPAKAGSTSLKSPAVPLPLNPGSGAENTETTKDKPAEQTSGIPPLTAPKATASPHKSAPRKTRASAERKTRPPVQVTPASTEDITVTPPPLQ